MANSSSLIKSLLHKTIAEGVYKEILSNASRYYYFLGKTLSWADETQPPYPTDELLYERDTRNNIITLKQIQPTDVAFVVQRYDWTTGTVYDTYDDQYSTKLIGVDISAGGTNYLNVPTVTIDPPDLPDGVQATGTATIYNNQVVAVTLTNQGSGYTNPPKVSFVDPLSGGSGAVAVGVVGASDSGVFRIENAKYYVMTDEYNVYKCLDNNNGAKSTSKPIGTQVLPISLADGYVWKYMFNVPIALRTKFLNEAYFPVVTALSQQFYSNGGIESVKIDNRGINYTAASLVVDGDGYLKNDPLYLTAVHTPIVGGTGYVDGDTLSIALPYSTVAVWTSGLSFSLGNNIQYANRAYTVTQAGTAGTNPPTHRSGTVANGTAALTYLGESPKAYPTFANTVISVTSVSGGSSYTLAPTVTFSAPPSGVTATGTAVLGTGSNSGKVVGITITNGGSGYSSAPTITFSNATGDTTGSGANFTANVSSAIFTVNLVGGIREVNLSSFGSGYTSNPPVTFTPPTLTFSGTAVNTTSEVITIGSHWFSTGDRVTYKNGGGTTIPGLVNNTTYWIIKSSSTAVKLASTLANANAGTAVNLTGAGVGSSHTLSNELDLPSASAVISPTGVVQRIRILDSGNNYPVAPTVTIGTPFTTSTAVNLGEQYIQGGKLYTVTQAGTTDASTVPSGTALGVAETNGTAKFTYVGTAAAGTAVLRYGYGYSGIPNIQAVTTTGTGFSAAFESVKSNAKVIPLLENGQLVGVQIDDPGIGYSTASITVAGNGTGALASADISVGNINTLQANNELLTVPGTINCIKLVSHGYAYGVATVNIIGDGTGATAVAYTQGGKVTQIVMTNQGQGYTYAQIVINGNGYGATARAIISPVNGHGKDAFDELYTKTLMFYNNVSRDKNQGFDVNNDYRQVGIIKNPRKFGSTARFAEPLGSGCFVIGGSFNVLQFTPDMLVTIPRLVDSNSELKRYVIVSVNSTGTSMLVQSLDGDIPLVGDQFTNPNNQFMGISAVSNPTVDKYSGDMLFIDNKAGFTPSADETVTLRTIITF
jgi:hypothetical protein